MWVVLEETWSKMKMYKERLVNFMVVKAKATNYYDMYIRTKA